MISEFTGDPPGFLAKYAVIVGDESQWDGKPVGTAKFTMKKGPANIVYLERKTILPPKDALTAYWLPWKTGIGVSLDLGTAAEWLFTSEMTNCRFTVLTEDGKAVKVAHLAGDLNTGKNRTDWEENPKNKFLTNKETQRARRFSRSGKELGYTGQIPNDDAASSSAFVFGRRQNDEWKFFTQVVGGFRTVINTKLLTDNITILNNSTMQSL